MRTFLAWSIKLSGGNHTQDGANFHFQILTWAVLHVHGFMTQCVPWYQVSLRQPQEP